MIRRYDFTVAFVLSLVAACGESSTDPAGTAGSSANAGGSTSQTTAGGSASTTGSGGSSSGSSGSNGSGGSSSGGSGAGGMADAAANQDGGAGAAGGAGAKDEGGTTAGDPFSFFVTSIESMRTLSKSQDGFGGDLRFGQADGLAGADEICRQVAEIGRAGAGNKQWRAFLSVAKGPDGQPVNAIDRVGDGPWYDRLGRLVAANKADLVQNRPKGADPAIINDLPNENGVPNHTDSAVDNHDTLTGSKADGTFAGSTATCLDWTSAAGDAASGKPQLGHSWPQTISGTGWIQAHTAGGCVPGVNLVQTGGPSGTTVGSAGGYGGIYCLALTP